MAPSFFLLLLVSAAPLVLAAARQLTRAALRSVRRGGDELLLELGEAAVLGAAGASHQGKLVAKGPYHARPSSGRGCALEESAPLAPFANFSAMR